MHCFAFDIETIPDIEAGRRLWDLGDLSDEDVATAMTFKRLQEAGTEFMPLHLHRVVAVSVALRTGDSFRVWSLGEADADEREIVARFFDGIERFAPTLVSWNGSGFDLPVLHYRGLLHGVVASRYWETGDSERDYRYNNYLGRFHWRHIDLMDVLSAYQARARAGLDDIAVMLGFPGKLGMSGDKVWGAWQAGDIAGIRNYCETDVINTYLVYLRFEFMRGRMSSADLEQEYERVRSTLAESGEAHFAEFLEAWQQANGR